MAKKLEWRLWFNEPGPGEYFVDERDLSDDYSLSDLLYDNYQHGLILVRVEKIDTNSIYGGARALVYDDDGVHEVNPDFCEDVEKLHQLVEEWPEAIYFYGYLEVGPVEI